MEVKAEVEVDPLLARSRSVESSEATQAWRWEVENETFTAMKMLYKPISFKAHHSMHFLSQISGPHCSS